VRPIYEIAREIAQDWKRVYFGAVPYLQAMRELTSISDMYGADDARSVVLYFLSNATTWRGDVARRIKKELNDMLKGKSSGLGCACGLGNVDYGLDAFTNSYIETALWSSLDDDEPMDKNHDVSDIAPELLAQMKKDCKSFYEKYEHLWGDNTDDQAGHDFWLTRNHHGAGFWDGDYEKGDELTKAAHTYGEFTLYAGDDGVIYGMRG